jgi:hypothetical protein
VAEEKDLGVWSCEEDEGVEMEHGEKADIVLLYI